MSLGIDGRQINHALVIYLPHYKCTWLQHIITMKKLKQSDTKRQFFVFKIAAFIADLHCSSAFALANPLFVWLSNIIECYMNAKHVVTNTTKKNGLINVMRGAQSTIAVI